MKIAVAATAGDASADVSLYGGRAPFFLIFDEQGNLLEAFSNPFLGMERHAGHEVARMMGEEGIDVFIGGILGPEILSDLTRRRIRCLSTSGSARSAVLELMP